MGKIQEILESGQFPGLHGTRDSFGIKKEFYSPFARKYITTWKEWEKAGYRDAKDESKGKPWEERFKEKSAEVKHRGDRQIKNIGDLV